MQGLGALKCTLMHAAPAVRCFLSTLSEAARVGMQSSPWRVPAARPPSQRMFLIGGRMFLVDELTAEGVRS